MIAKRGAQRMLGRAAILVVAGMTSCGDAESAGRRDFFELLVYGVSVQAESADGPAELARLSELVVVGEIAAVHAGGVAAGVPTVVVELRCDELLKGSVLPRIVYVELFRSSATSAARLQEELPTHGGIWFLQNVTAGASSPLDRDRRNGVPGNETLWTVPSQQGLVVESSEGLVQPLESEPSHWMPNLRADSSLAQVAARIRNDPHARDSAP